MAETIEYAYERMMSFYYKWAYHPKPEKECAVETLMSEPDILDRMGSFRDEQWRDYVRARDIYLDLVKRSKLQ